MGDPEIDVKARANEMDLLPHLDSHLDTVLFNLNSVNPSAQVVQGQYASRRGVDEWCSWLTGWAEFTQVLATGNISIYTPVAPTSRSLCSDGTPQGQDAITEHAPLSWPRRPRSGMRASVDAGRPALSRSRSSARHRCPT